MEKMFSTNDMYLVATLISYGAEIENVDKTNPKKQVFSFRSLPKAIWVLCGEDEIKSQKVINVSEIKAMMVSERLVFPPNFISSLKNVRSYFYEE